MGETAAIGIFDNTELLMLVLVGANYSTYNEYLPSTAVFGLQLHGSVGNQQVCILRTGCTVELHFHV